MNKSKKLFLIISGLFILAMVAIGIDISNKTTFPGAKKNLKERLSPSDTITVRTDTNRHSWLDQESRNRK